MHKFVNVGDISQLAPDGTFQTALQTVDWCELL